MGESLVIAIGAGNPRTGRSRVEIRKAEPEHAVLIAASAVMSAAKPIVVSVLGPDGEYRWLAMPIARRVQPQPAAAQL